MADEMPGGGGLRRHERHAAVGVGVVRQRLGHDAADARPVSLALRPHCAAGRRLCGPAVLSKRAAGDPGAPSQHGRADLAGRDPGARHVGGRDRDACRACLFRFRRHAVVLPAVRPLSRPRDAPQDAGGGGQPGGPEGAVRASAGGQRRGGARAGRRGETGRPAAGAAGRPDRGRRRRHLRHLGDRREPGHRRDRAAENHRGRAGLCRRHEFLRSADDPGHRRGRRDAHRRRRAAAAKGDRGEVAHRAPGRPRRQAVCPVRACDRRPDRDRLAHRRRIACTTRSSPPSRC